MVTISQIISKIETRQVVQNKDTLPLVDDKKAVCRVASLATAAATDLTFMSKDMFVTLLPECSAGVIIIKDKWLHLLPKSSLGLVVADPYLAYASCSQLFEIETPQKNSIHPTVILPNSVVVGTNVNIGAYCVIGDNVQIGENTCISSNVTIEKDSIIGSNCVIKSNVTIADHTKIGNDVRIHAGSCIGNEGFGFAPSANPAKSSAAEINSNSLKSNEIGGWERIAQLGCVLIGNHVRIGANTTIDRGAIDDTVIEDNVIIDNLVQIAHNVKIGAGSAIAAKSGIAGSSRLGKRCIIAGAVGIAGHLELCDDVHVTAMSMVTKSITKSGSYSSGNSAMPSQQWRRAFVKLRKMGLR